MVNVPAEWLFEGVCVCAKGPNPALALQTPLQRFYSISETAIAVRVRLNMVLATDGRIGKGAARNRPSILALRAQRDMCIVLINGALADVSREA